MSSPQGLVAGRVAAIGQVAAMLSAATDSGNVDPIKSLASDVPRGREVPSLLHQSSTEEGDPHGC